MLPGGVEGLLYWLVSSGTYSFGALLVTATFGNTLGGVITFYMGRLLYRGVANLSEKQSSQSMTPNHIRSRLSRFASLFELKEASVERVRKWGTPILFFSWLPIVGDPLCIAAGYLRLPVLASIVFIGVGKFCRYLVLLWALV